MSARQAVEVRLDIRGEHRQSQRLFQSSVRPCRQLRAASALCEVARANLLLNDIRNAEVMNVGLSSADAVADISMQPGNHGGSSLHPGQAHAGGRTVQVKLVRGDDLMPGLLAPDDRLTFIKIDVEGHEQEALGGLTATIAAHRPVIWFEAHSKAFAEATLAAIGGRAAYPHVYLFGVDPVEPQGPAASPRPCRGSRAKRGMHVRLTPLETVPDPTNTST